jgi:GT2 family glycosyltransferase/glycosyltransferase involved in cell wall biosynthesis
MNETARIYVGTDRSQWIGVQVLEYSIRKHSSIAIELHSMADLAMPEPKDPRHSQRTGFSFCRFAIPQLAGYSGRAVYLDADMLVFKDFVELWRIPFDRAKVVIQDDILQAPATSQEKAVPAKKRIKQCAVMLLDCGRLDWDVNALVGGLGERYSYEELVYQLCILEPEEIAYRVPFEWNSLEHYDENTGLLHYTDMHTQPWVSTENPLGYLWIAHLNEMIEAGLCTRGEIAREIALGYARPSLSLELAETAGARPPTADEISRFKEYDRAADFVPHAAVYEAKRRRAQAIEDYVRSVDLPKPTDRKRSAPALKRPKWLKALLAPLKSKARPRLYDAISTSGLFDGSWYLGMYADVRDRKVDPLTHYLRHGAQEGRNPNPMFDTAWYLAHNPDVAAVEINPLLHYIRFGANEGRDPGPEFSTLGYLRHNPDVAAAGVNPLQHYLQHGSKEGRSPRPTTKGPQSHQRIQPPDALDVFEAWQVFNAPSKGRRRALLEAASEAANGAVFSVVVRANDGQSDRLRETVESVLRQSYQRFEVILRARPSATPELEAWAGQDARIRFVPVVGSGSVPATSDASAAEGEFVIVLDSGSVLHPDALTFFSQYIVRRPDTDILYSDDADIRADGNGLVNPRFKPDWSPELLLSYYYVSQLVAVRRSIYESIVQKECSHTAVQDYDVILRASERAGHIGHIAQLLCSRRASSSAAVPTGDSGARAIEEAFARRGIQCTVQKADWTFDSKTPVYVPVMPDDGPSIAIIIPTKNHWDLVETLLRSLKQTTYRNYKIYIVDNMSDEQETLDYLASLSHTVLRIPNPGSSFSFAHINNRAVEKVAEDYVLFLNNDTEVINPRWLSQMMGWARLPGAGAVGARLIYHDGRVQHGGVVVGLRCGFTAFRGLSVEEPGYLGYAKVTRNCSAVTAAAMLTPRDLFIKLGGFDEEAFAISYNDVDYCLRLQDAGLRSVYCAEAELYHHGSYTREKVLALHEAAALRKRYELRDDPYYSPHLSQDTNRYDIKPKVVPSAPAHRPLRLLAVLDSLDHAGRPKSICDLLADLKRLDVIDPVVVSRRSGGLERDNELNGIPTAIMRDLIPLDAASSIHDYERNIDAVRDRMNLRSFDLVFVDSAMLFWAIDAAQMCGVPSVWSIPEGQSRQALFSRLARPVATRALECCDFAYRLVFPSEGGRRQWMSTDRLGSLDVIRTGLNVDRFAGDTASQTRQAVRSSLGLTDDDVCILTLSTGKGDLVSALQQTPEDVAMRAFFLIVNAATAKHDESFDAITKDLPRALRRRVHLVHEQSELTAYWNAADVFWNAYHHESYPRAVLEAMAKGVPIVEPLTLGAGEQVRANVNALLYRGGKSADAADCIARIVRDSELRRRMGAGSKDVFAALSSYDAMLRRYSDLFLAASQSAVPAREAGAVQQSAAAAAQG